MHDLFTNCSRFVHELVMTYSWLVHDMFNTCIWIFCDLLMTCYLLMTCSNYMIYLTKSNIYWITWTTITTLTTSFKLFHGKEWKSCIVAMNKLWKSHEPAINKSWTSYEQAMTYSWLVHYLSMTCSWLVLVHNYYTTCSFLFIWALLLHNLLPSSAPAPTPAKLGWDSFILN